MNLSENIYVSLVLDQLFDIIYEFSQKMLDCSVCNLCMFDTIAGVLIK
jgi:uroporphyrinogen-III decarboxylase